MKKGVRLEMISLRIAFVAALTLISACDRKEKEKDPKPPVDQNRSSEDSEESALDFSDFEYPSFDDVSLEQKCDGIKKFFDHLAKKYISQDLKIDIDTSECGVPSSYYKPGQESLKVDITFSRDEKYVIMRPMVDLVYSAVGHQIVSKEANHFTSAEPSDLKYPFTDFLGVSARRFAKSFTQWMDKDSSTNGIQTYLDFVSGIEKNYGNESMGLKLKLDSATRWVREPIKEGPDAIDPEKKWITIQFEPSSEVGVGKLKILDAGSEVFRELDHQGRAFDCTFFDCTDSLCLREKEFTYRFYGANLYLVGEEEIDGKSVSRSRFLYRFTSDNVPSI